ncbi:hypothetical protein ACFX13_043883 [Malus domestica]
MEEDGEIQSPASGGSRSPASTRQNGRITVTVAVPPAQVPASNRPTTWTSSIGMLKRLQTVALYTSLLSGSIPEKIGNYSELQNQYLYQYSITSPIPKRIGELGKLQESVAVAEQLGWFNPNYQLTGNIPESLSYCQNLQGLDLPYNNLFGSIPRNVFGLQNLTKLLLLSNDLSGFIPPDIGNCTNLYRLRLNHNRLSGTVPLEIGNLKSLNFVDLSNNRLVGEIPPSISGCQNLEYLDHHSNGITGSVPGTLPKSLQFVDISDNRLTGQLSHSIGSLTELTKLNLEKNQLSGSIPAEILSCNKPQPLHMVRTPGTSGLSFHDGFNTLHNLQGDVVAADVIEFSQQRDTVDGTTTMVTAKLARGRNFPMGSQHQQRQNLNLAPKDSDEGDLIFSQRNTGLSPSLLPPQHLAPSTSSFPASSSGLLISTATCHSRNLLLRLLPRSCQ